MNGATTWWWVRHGPTHEKAFTGWRDVPADLSDAAQLARLRAFLPNDAVLIASDLKRASATADAICASQTRLPDTAALREFDFGAWDGRTFDEVAKSHPKLSREYWESPGDVAPPAGESWNNLSTRVSAKVAQLNARHCGRHIIAVAHIGVILTRVQIAAAVSAKQALSHHIDTLSVTCLHWENNQWQVKTINHIP